jgi:hypothetical protein
MKNLRQRTLIAAILLNATCVLGTQLGLPAMAQVPGATTTLMNPYVPGVIITPPNTAVGYTPAPPIGCGLTNSPLVTPGQIGPAPLMPWVTNIPANTIDQDTSQLTLPVDASSLNAPYTLGPSLQGSIPGPPSAQGAIPTMLQTPTGVSAYAVQVTVPTGGVLTDGSAPTSRSGRQYTQNFGIQSTTSSYVTDFGIQPSQNPNVAQTPQVTDNGPFQTTYPGVYGSTTNASPNLPNANYVSVGTGNHTQFQGSSIQARQVIAPY